MGSCKAKYGKNLPAWLDLDTVCENRISTEGACWGMILKLWFGILIVLGSVKLGELMAHTIDHMITKAGEHK